MMVLEVFAISLKTFFLKSNYRTLSYIVQPIAAAQKSVGYENLLFGLLHQYFSALLAHLHNNVPQNPAPRFQLRKA